VVSSLPYFGTSRLFAETLSTACSVSSGLAPHQTSPDITAAPDGQTCGAYAGAFAQAVGGYIGNPDSMGDCNFCQYSVGQSFYAPLGISYSTRGRDLGIFVSLALSWHGQGQSADIQAAYTVFNILVLLLAARFLQYTKR
jgi:ATP-binding cassette subfamily G (WHITE) protein 2 (SNQ2)